MKSLEIYNGEIFLDIKETSPFFIIEDAMLFELKTLDRASPCFQEFYDGMASAVTPCPSLEYLQGRGSCKVIVRKGKLVGGFCIVDAPPFHLHAIVQIPDVLDHWHMFDPYVDDAAEITGFFLKEAAMAPLLCLYMSWVIFFHRAGQFVYSYSESQKDIVQLCSTCAWCRLYVGPTLESRQINRVDVLTTWGVLKIIFNLTKSFIIRRLFNGKRARL